MATSESWLDANVILRYLLNDHPDHSPRARALIEAAERGEHRLKVAPHVLCEVVYILEGEGYARKDIHGALRDLMLVEGVEVLGSDTTLAALADYRDKNVDLSDALLAAFARARDEKVWTFSRKHFSRLDVSWGEPPHA